MKNKNKYLYVITSFLCLTLILSSFSFAKNQNNENGDYLVINNVTGSSKNNFNDYALSSDFNDNISSDTIVDVIIQMEDNSLLDNFKNIDSSLSLTSYVNSINADEYSANLISKQNKLFKKIQDEVSLFSYKYSYTTILNGFAAETKYSDISTLEKIDGVKKVIIAEKYNIPETTSVDNTGVVENDVNVYETGIYKNDTKYDGSGTIVAILDTGLDYTHSAFQIQPTGKLAITKDKVNSIVKQSQAYELSLDAEDPFTLTGDQLWVSSKVPFAYDYADQDADVYPLEDHGTHVAGIIAGKDNTITGVATNAQLAIMKVFPDSGDGASTDTILAALNDCILLGVDVINMSLGSSCGFSRASDDESINEVYDAIKQAGITLTVAASNDYSSAKGGEKADTNLTSSPDSGTIGSPGSYDASFSVASISGVKTSYGYANNETPVYFTESNQNGTTKNDFVKSLLNGEDSKTFEYVTIGGVGNLSDYLGLDVKDKIVLVKRGTTTFEEKALIAEAKGAAAMICYNNISGEISMSVGNKVQIPTASISMDTGKILASYDEGTIEFSTSYKAGPFMSNFSSWGVLPDLELKPDITSHGGDIYSSVRGGYDTYSGTSMACPNMAGASVIVRQYIKDTYPDLPSDELSSFVQQLMMSTATIAYNEEGNPYSPRKQGAGLANILAATSTSSYLWVEGQDKTKISFGDDPDKNGTYTFSFNLTNLTNLSQSFNIDDLVFSESVSSDKETVAEKAYMFDDTTKEISVENGSLSANNMISLGGYQTAKITYTINLSTADKEYLDQNFINGMYVEGFVTLDNTNNQDYDLSIPFCGFYGDWTSAPIFDYSAYEIGESNMDDSISDYDKLVTRTYATVPMGGWDYGNGEIGAWGLGAYGYKVADGYDTPETLEKYAAVSLDPDAQFEIVYVAAGLYRNAKTITITITDTETGEVIYEDIFYDARKSHYSSGTRVPSYINVYFDPSEYGLKNNSEYEIKLDATLDWEGEQHLTSSTFASTFRIDSEAPTLEYAQTRIKTNSKKENTYYLDMYVYDNQYIQCYQIGTYDYIDDDGNVVGYQAFVDYTIPVSSVQGTTNRISFDITDYMDQIASADGKIYVQYIDYAKNVSTYEIELPVVVPSSVEIVKDGTPVEEITVKKNATYDLYNYVNLDSSLSWFEKLTWSSSDETIAKAYQGEVFGVSEGDCNITVTSENGAYYTFTVHVVSSNNSSPTLSKLQLNQSSLSLNQGDSYELYITLKPWTLTEDYIKENVNVTWRTTNENIVAISVDENNPLKATIYAKDEGSASVIVQSGKYITSKCEVTVKEMFEVEGTLLKSYYGVGDENGVVEIPDDLGIIYIYQYAFYNNDSIKKVIIPEGVTEIQYAAFYGCDNLEEVVLPSTCTTLRDFSFAWCPNLKKINFDDVTTIFKRAFVYDTALEDVDFSHVYSIGYLSFYGCSSLKNINLASCGSIGELAFGYCTSLTEIIFGNETNIGKMSFYHCSSLSYLTLPSKIISSQAFYACTNLKEVTFTNDVTLIDTYAFFYCSSLREINFMGDCETINDYAFTYCTSLESVTLPSGLKYLGELAFAEDTSLQEVTISKDCLLTTISRATFGDDTGFEKFIVEEGNPYLTALDGILYDKGMTKLILVPQNKYVGSLTLPDSVITIGAYAFAYNLATVSVDLSNVETIEEGAFLYVCYLSSITYDHVKYIGDYAFYYCYSLKELPINNQVEYIGDYAFYDASDNIGYTYTLTLPENIKYIGEGAFYGIYTIDKVIINASINSLSDYLFAYCTSLEEIIYHASIETIGKYAFAYSGLTSNALNDEVREVQQGAFAYCSSLTNVTLNNVLTTIEDNLFEGCTSLENIVIPQNIITIGKNAFKGCSALVNVDFANVETIEENAFNDTLIEVLNGEKITYVGANSFSDLSSLKTVNLPLVTYIDEYAFARDYALENVNIPAIKIIQDYAFVNDSLITSLNLEHVTKIGANALDSTSLSEVNLSQIKVLKAYALANTKITNISFNESLKEIDSTSLNNIQTLKKINVSNNDKYFTNEDVLYRILDNGFFELITYPCGKEDVSYIIIDDTIRIASYALENVTSLEEITFPSSLSSIGNGAFLGANALRLITSNAVQSPTLESLYDENNNQNYDNFITHINNGATSITLYIPKNGIGYDSLVYRSYFNEEKIITQNINMPDMNVIYFIHELNKYDDNALLTKTQKDTLYDLYISIPKNMLSFISDEQLAFYQSLIK